MRGSWTYSLAMEDTNVRYQIILDILSLMDTYGSIDSIDRSCQQLFVAAWPRLVMCDIMGSSWVPAMGQLWHSDFAGQGPKRLRHQSCVETRISAEFEMILKSAWDVSEPLPSRTQTWSLVSNIFGMFGMDDPN